MSASRLGSELTSLADGTGGRSYFPRDYARIPEAYRDAARDLKSGYYLTYASNRVKGRNTYPRPLHPYAARHWFPHD